ncbi:MAG: hypothetical protein ACLGH4_10495, partial [Actinomycetes bacterium]
LAHRWQYRTLERLQAGLLHVPRALLPAAVWLFAHGPIARVAQHYYWDLADPYRLETAPGVGSSAVATAAQCATGPAARRPEDPSLAPGESP